MRSSTVCRRRTAARIVTTTSMCVAVPRICMSVHARIAVSCVSCVSCACMCVRLRTHAYSLGCVHAHVIRRTRPQTTSPSVHVAVCGDACQCHAVNYRLCAVARMDRRPRRLPSRPSIALASRATIRTGRAMPRQPRCMNAKCIMHACMRQACLRSHKCACTHTCKIGMHACTLTNML